MIARAVIMIRPAAFGYNPETASSNAFQSLSHLPAAAVQASALAEFDAMADMLQKAGIEVEVFDDTTDVPKPDAVFLNNWFSTHSSGKVIVYPMLSPLRRNERRPDLIHALQATRQVDETIDITAYEQAGRYLEGTGSMVMDHAEKTIYLALSPRSDEGLARIVAEALNYNVIAFNTAGKMGEAVYHTNVVMCIAPQVAVVCEEVIASNRDVVMDTLRRTREVVSISRAQFENFAGNMLMLQNNRGRTYMVMSERALQSLRPEHVKAIERHASILASSLNTIESIGGGSARCMIAENFLAGR